MKYYDPSGYSKVDANTNYCNFATRNINRYGYDRVTFVSRKGMLYTERGLPIGTDAKPYTVFEVVEPVDVNTGKIAPWFGEKGGGIQYEFSQTISELLEKGVLRKVGK